MKDKTLVIDYQAGNLISVCKALRAMGADVAVAKRAKDLRNAAHIVLPGVGHFSATRFLTESGIASRVRKEVDAGTPFLGICVGLQWLFAGSTEAPETRGMGIFPSWCDRFPANVKSPHVGWNSLECIRESRLLKGLPHSSYVYYTHSYRAGIVNKTSAVTNYGERFSAVVERDNWMAVQFHPEKSGAVGLRILKNFLDVPKC